MKLEMLLNGLTGYIEDLDETTTINLSDFMEDYEIDRTDRNYQKVWESVKGLEGVKAYKRFHRSYVYEIIVSR